MDGLAQAIQKASVKPDKRKVMSSTPEGKALRQIGNMHAKYLAGQKEAPARSS